MYLREVKAVRFLLQNNKSETVLVRMEYFNGNNKETHSLCKEIIYKKFQIRFEQLPIIISMMKGLNLINMMQKPKGCFFVLVFCD